MSDSIGWKSRLVDPCIYYRLSPWELLHGWLAGIVECMEEALDGLLYIDLAGSSGVFWQYWCLLRNAGSLRKSDKVYERHLWVDSFVIIYIKI